MRRYFFDIRIGDQIGEDDDAQVLPDLDAVQKEALRTLADVAKELSEFPPDLAVQVRDDHGSVMCVKVIFEIDRTN